VGEPNDDERRPERRSSSKRHTRPTYERGDDYDRRWDQLAATGVDVHGEANFVEQLLREHGGRRVLDAGCGTGRIAIELARRGFDVVGVDIDPTMLDAARRKAGELKWVLADLSQLALDETFDAVVLGGNVIVFVGPGNEREVLRRLAAHLSPGGVLVSGFQIDTGRYALADYDADAESVDFTLTSRFATWEQAPFEGGGYAVSVHTKD
jgi:2-polyprenyl-3-methyl-5-hydroxy-6-metoxy-1,4-benzoquinol methylase